MTKTPSISEGEISKRAKRCVNSFKENPLSTNKRVLLAVLELPDVENAVENAVEFAVEFAFKIDSTIRQFPALPLPSEAKRNKLRLLQLMM